MSVAYAPPAAEPEEDEPKEAEKGRKLSEEDLNLMRAEYERGVTREKINRENARESLKFKVGEQWPQAELDRRGDRPALTFNRSLATIRQVTGDVRQNKPAIRVRPKGDGADKETAEMWGGLIRDIEQRSHAGYVYAQAADNSTSCGFGYWRIATDYAGDDSFEQDIFLKPIPNALSVVRDPDAQEIDKSDAKWWFVYTGIPREEFKKQYPKARAESFEKNDAGYDDSMAGWYAGDNVRVAEYWCKKPILKTICQLSDGRVICKDDYDPQKLREVMGGATVVKERSRKSHEVWQHIVSGAEELEEPTKWATDDIPIIEVGGEETWVDERRVTYGLIHFAKDAMRAYNYARSTSIEVTALQPKAPYKLSKAMIAGYEEMWNNAGNVALPYLLYNSDPNLPNRTPEREQPPIPAAGLIAEAQIAADDIKAITGVYDASLGARSNETSGKAINERKQEGDISTFVYIDNLALAIATCGKQLIKLIPKIYDTQRVMRILYDDGTDEQVKVNVPTEPGSAKLRHDPKKGFYDLAVGKYDIVVEAGPGFTTRRQEAAEGILEMMRILGPEAAPLLGPRLAEMQDWPKSTEIAEDLKKLLPPQLQEPEMDPETGQPMPKPEPPPPPEALKAQAEMAAMADRQKFDEASGRATMELKKELQDAEIQLARERAMAEVQLQRDVATAKANLERESHDNKMNLQREAAVTEKKTREEVNGPDTNTALGEVMTGLQQLAGVMAAFVQVSLAPSTVVNDASGNVVGVRKELSPDQLAGVDQALAAALTAPKEVVNDDQGNVQGVA